MPNTHQAPHSHRRLLRVGIIHGKRIVEERLVSATSAVTIGTSPRATFIVPWDDVPDRWRLFEQRRRPPHPAPRPAECRRASRRRRAATSPTSTASAGASRSRFLTTRAARSPSATRRCCSSCCARPRRNRARACRFRCSGAALDGVERGFLAVLAATLALHVAVVVYLRQVEWPRRPSIEEVPDRFVSNIVRTPRPAPPPAPAATTAARTTPAPSSARRPHAPSPPSRPADRSRRADPRSSRSAGPQHRLPLDPPRARRRRQLADRRRARLGRRRSAMDEAFKNIGGLGVASLDALPGLRPSGGHGKVGTVDSLRIGSRHRRARSHRPGRRRTRRRVARRRRSPGARIGDGRPRRHRPRHPRPAQSDRRLLRTRAEVEPGAGRQAGRAVFDRLGGNRRRGRRR